MRELSVRDGTDRVPLLDPPRLEHIRDPRHLAEQLNVGDLLVLSRLVGLVQDGDLCVTDAKGK